MSRPLATSAIALILGAAPALADVTPAEVWQNLRDSYQQVGYTVTVGSEDASDDAVTLNNVVLTTEDENAADMTLTIPAIALTAVGDGSVRSVIEGQMTLEMRDTDPEGEPIGFSVTVDAPGNVTLSSGTPDQMQHSFAMPTVAFAGRALDDVNTVPVTATVTGVEGNQAIDTAPDGSTSQTYQGRAETFAMQIAASGPALSEAATEATDDFGADITITDLTMQGQSTVPAESVSFADQPSAAQAGFAGNDTFGMGPINVVFTSSTIGSDGAAQESSGSMTAASATVAASISVEGLSYEGAATQMETSLTSTDMPFPIAYAAAENRFRLAMPVVASDQDQPFALTYLLDGLTLDEAIWQALDPEATLPRDPARLSIDLEGLALLTRNFMDPDVADAPDNQAEMPFQPRSLTINDVTVDAAGARAKMAGELTFGDDPSQPVGRINGTFGGVNTLLDRLVAMGVLPQEQLMGPRMMIAMFARPVDGAEDELQTEIEFREGGSIFANGQQIQ